MCGRQFGSFLFELDHATGQDSRPLSLGPTGSWRRRLGSGGCVPPQSPAAPGRSAGRVCVGCRGWSPAVRRRRLSSGGRLKPLASEALLGDPSGAACAGVPRRKLRGSCASAPTPPFRNGGSAFSCMAALCDRCHSWCRCWSSCWGCWGCWWWWGRRRQGHDSSPSAEGAAWRPPNMLGPAPRSPPRPASGSVPRSSSLSKEVKPWQGSRNIPGKAGIPTLLPLAPLSWKPPPQSPSPPPPPKRFNPEVSRQFKSKGL